jgi:phage terminase large subunit
MRQAVSRSKSGAMVMNLRSQQDDVLTSLKRFNVLLAHRRFGKTVLAICILILKALECKHHKPQVHYFCPTYSQAKRVAWAYVKDFCQHIPGTVFNESELKVTFPTGAVLQLGSADNPDANRGIYSDFAVMDEPAQMPPSMWFEVLRPALSDRKGGVLFIGTPAGRHGLFYDLWTQAETDPDFWRGCYRADETGIVDDQELESAQRGMSVSEYAQEFLCSWDAAIKGAYWATEMDVAEQSGRVTSLVPLYGEPVHISLDLGMNDATACWFFQMDGEKIRMLDYSEYTNMGLPAIVDDWKARGYRYGKVICPHDINVHSLSTGQTRRDTFRALGVDTLVAPKGEVIDGINAVRAMLPRITFDRDKCRDGIEALRQYRADWQEKKNVLQLRPLHDWTSHGADAMRYLAVHGTSALANEWGTAIDYRYIDKGVTV